MDQSTQLHKVFHTGDPHFSLVKSIYMFHIGGEIHTGDPHNSHRFTMGAYLSPNSTLYTTVSYSASKNVWDVDQTSYVQPMLLNKL